MCFLFVHPLLCPSTHSESVSSEPVNAVNPLAESSQDGGQRKMRGCWKDRERGGREGRRGVFVLGLAYLD